MLDPKVCDYTHCNSLKCNTTFIAGYCNTFFICEFSYNKDFPERGGN